MSTARLQDLERRLGLVGLEEALGAACARGPEPASTARRAGEILEAAARAEAAQLADRGGRDREALVGILATLCGVAPFLARFFVRHPQWLFALLDEERTEVWYGAADTLQNLHPRRWENPDSFRERKNSLTGKARLRLEMAGSHSPEYRNELQRMGDGAYEFLASCATYGVFARCPPLFRRACDMLAFLEDDDAIEVLISALEQLHANGKCDQRGPTSLAPGYALRAINRLTGEDYGGFGQDFDSMSVDSVEKVDWPAVLAELRAAFPK